MRPRRLRCTRTDRLTPTCFDRFIAGAVDVCDAVDAEYVGGDLDTHEEFTTASTAIGKIAAAGAVRRSGAEPGDALCVTGQWGRSAAALRLFERGDSTSIERANDLFQFIPRVADGLALADDATAMMDSSDGLARSLHQLAEASGIGFTLDRDALPVHSAVDEVAEGPEERFELAAHFGEDFELVCTVPETAFERVRDRCPGGLVRVGRVVDAPNDVSVDGDDLPDRGYTHG